MRFKEVYKVVKLALLRCLLNSCLVEHSFMCVGKVTHKCPLQYLNFFRLICMF